MTARPSGLTGRSARRAVLATASSSLAIAMAATTAAAAAPASAAMPQASAPTQAGTTLGAVAPTNASWDLDDAPATADQSGTHTVVAGDTVAKLAQQYGSTVSGIIAANGLNAQALIHVGETLSIPAGGSASSGGSSASTESNRSSGASRSTTRTEAPSSSSAEASAPTSSVKSSAPASAANSSIVSIALQYVGTPYVWGGSTPSGFDCSGFTSYVYAQAGISIPRSSSAQRGAGTQVSASAARPGDLVWWPGHVGIYVGNGQYAAAHSPGNPLSVRDIYRSNPTYIRVG